MCAASLLAGALLPFLPGPGATSCRAQAAPQADHTVTLAVFSVNDFHGSFLADPAKGIPGVVAVCHTLDSLKRVYPYHATVAAGDNFGGSYFSTVTEAALLPVMFNEMGITVSAVGNHEFDTPLRRERGETFPDAVSKCGFRRAHHIDYPRTDARFEREGAHL